MAISSLLSCFDIAFEKKEINFFFGCENFKYIQWGIAHEDPNIVQFNIKALVRCVLTSAKELTACAG